MTTATTTFKVGDKVGMVDTLKGVMLNLTVHAIRPQNMVEVMEHRDMHATGDDLLSVTWGVPCERLFKR